MFKLSYINDIKADVKTYFLILFVLLEVSVLYLNISSQNPILSLIFLFFLIILPFVIGSPSTLSIILLAYIIILPSAEWGQRYEFFIIYNNRLYIGLILIILASQIYILSLNTAHQANKITIVDSLLLVFLGYSILNFFYSLYLQNDPNYSVMDLYFILLYSSFFLFRWIIKSRKTLRKFYIAILIISLITSFEYILMTLSQANITSIFLKRSYTQQPHIAIYSIPILLGIILYPQKKTFKIIAIIALISNIIMVLFSQQRGLWLGIISSVFLMYFLYYFQSGFSVSRILKFSYSLLLSMLFVVIILLLVEKIFHVSFLLTFLKRLFSLGNIQGDYSLNMRFIQIDLALKEWYKNIIIGGGLGATIKRFIGARIVDGIDNSYLFVLWKLGIIGFILFVSTYFISIFNGIKTFFKLDLIFDKLFLSANITALFGIMIVALSNMSIIRYRFNIIWALILAVIVFYSSNSGRIKND